MPVESTIPNSNFGEGCLELGQLANLRIGFVGYKNIIKIFFENGGENASLVSATRKSISNMPSTLKFLSLTKYIIAKLIKFFAAVMMMYFCFMFLRNHVLVCYVLILNFSK